MKASGYGASVLGLFHLMNSGLPSEEGVGGG